MNRENNTERGGEGPYCYNCGRKLAKKTIKNGILWFECESCGNYSEYADSIPPAAPAMKRDQEAPLTPFGEQLKRQFDGWYAGFVHVLERDERFDMSCAYEAGYRAAMKRDPAPLREALESIIRACDSHSGADKGVIKRTAERALGRGE